MLMPASASGAPDAPGPRSASDAGAVSERAEHDVVPADASVRVPFVHGCLLTTRARTRGGLVCNLSVAGVYVTLDEPLPDCGDSVHLVVQLPGEAPLLEADTVVTWQNRRTASSADSLPVGVGLRFVSIVPVHRARVAGLVKNPAAALPHAGPKRVHYLRHCCFSTKTAKTETIICNLSRLGAYVSINPVPEIDEPVSVAFSLPERKTIELQAVVAWRNPGPSLGADPARPDLLPPGCGVRFVGMSEADEKQLASVLEVLT